MNRNNAIIIAVVIVAAVSVIVLSKNMAEDKTTTAQSDATQERVVVQNSLETAAIQAETTEMMVDDAGVEPMTDEDIVVTASGSYESYSTEKIARAEKGKVVLFFHASWCPSCRALNGDIEKNADVIPSGVTILKTNYDQETELKKKYGVTTQHTLVQVDKEGTMLGKWSGGSKLVDLLAQIK